MPEVSVTAIKNSEKSSPDISDGGDTPATGSAEKLVSGQGSNHSDSEDSWSVIYSSDDLNSINDTESKLTESSNEDDQHCDATLNDTTELDNDAGSMATIAHMNRNNDDGTTSISTLRKGSNDSWNESLSIPKLSMRDSSEIPSIEMATIEPTMTNISVRDTDSCGRGVWENIVNYYHQFVKEMNENQVLIKLQSRGKIPFYLIIVKALVIICMIYMYFLQPNSKNSQITFLEAKGPNYQSITNYLMCESNGALAIIDRNPIKNNIERIFFSGVDSSKIPQFHEEIMQFLDILSPLSDFNLQEEIESYNFGWRSHGHHSINAKTFQIVDFMNEMCGNDPFIYVSKEKFAVVLTQKVNSLSKFSKKIIKQYPKVLLKDVENFSNSKEFITVEIETLSSKILKNSNEMIQNIAKNPVMLNLNDKILNIKQKDWDNEINDLKGKLFIVKRNLLGKFDTISSKSRKGAAVSWTNFTKFYKLAELNSVSIMQRTSKLLKQKYLIWSPLVQKHLIKSGKFSWKLLKRYDEFVNDMVYTQGSRLLKYTKDTGLKASQQSYQLSKKFYYKLLINLNFLQKRMNNELPDLKFKLINEFNNLVSYLRNELQQYRRE